MLATDIKPQQKEAAFKGIFGITLPPVLKETDFENAKQYKQYVAAETDDYNSKKQLFDSAWRVIRTFYYKHGGIILTGAPGIKPETAAINIFDDTMIIVANESGSEQTESEDLAMTVEVPFFQNSIEFIPRKSIIGYGIQKHKCPNPDCPACKNKKADHIPYSIEITTQTGSYYIYERFYSTAQSIIEEIECWRLGVPYIKLQQPVN